MEITLVGGDKMNYYGIVGTMTSHLASRPETVSSFHSDPSSLYKHVNPGGEEGFPEQIEPEGGRW